MVLGVLFEPQASGTASHRAGPGNSDRRISDSLTQPTVAPMSTADAPRVKRSQPVPPARAMSPALPPTASAAPASTPDIRHDDLRRLQWLRDFAIAGLVVVALLAQPLFYTRLPLLPVFLLLGLWAVLSLLTWLRLRRPAAVSPQEFLTHLILDLLFLTTLLALSGGPANPLTALYLLPVAMAAAVLSLRQAGLIVLLAILAYSALWWVSLPLTVEDVDRAMQMHLSGMWLTLALSALLIAGFIGQTTLALRQRERQLATAREQALRDERIVALGNLAAGAAHELGTPLATMAVLAGELAEDATLTPAQRDDLQLLRQQIAACKDIISHLAERTGIQRAEAGKALAFDQWLRQLVDRWQSLRPAIVPVLHFEQATSAAPRIFIETTLEQALLNLLNNAADASPQEVILLASWPADLQSAAMLRIDILDQGPGIDADLLAQAGREFLNTQSGGQGIGLFLAHADIERVEIPLSPRLVERHKDHE